MSAARVLVLGSVCSLFALSCNAVVKGNGVLTEQERRAVAEFNRVSIANNLNATLSIGPANIKVKVDENLQEYVVTRFSGETLVIETKEGYEINPSVPAYVTVTSPTLLAFNASGSSKLQVVPSPGSLTFDASGSSQISATGIGADAVGVNGSGSSEITLAGAATRTLGATLSGSTKLASGMPAVAFAFDVSGDCRVDVPVTGSVKGNASGSARVVIHGDPSSKDTETSGSATITYEP